MISIKLPLLEECNLKPGDMVQLTGTIYCGRDAVLPRIAKRAKEQTLEKDGIDLKGGVIFHTAVSRAGIAPTTTSKPEIEGSMVPLSESGVRFHIGKGRISQSTIDGLKKSGGYFLVTPPTAALLTACMTSMEVAAYPEEGIEAFYRIEVKDFPAIVAVANGQTVFPEQGGAM